MGRRYQAAAFFHWFEDEFVKAIMNFIVADSKATFKKTYKVQYLTQELKDSS